MPAAILSRMRESPGVPPIIHILLNSEVKLSRARRTSTVVMEGAGEKPGSKDERTGLLMHDKPDRLLKQAGIPVLT
uniref:Uncharacterized protein n=1 Tax=Utricularia reniformis TaxID=192314 RepID=A0A1Y0B1E4_9LAMI|nr:hypothetical protein AEK19_MT0953 [Utricularia reniformis]ART31179.1 hypothetical protein AEK19_MT0953 [Utricularia reniformis]